MKFRFLKAENFLSLGDVKLKLANRGVVLIMGENRDASGASSNGAGKSAIWDAMVWGLFGKTLRGITGDDVVNLKAKKNCKVRLSLKDDAGQDVKIIRYRKHKDGGNGLLLQVDGRDCSRRTAAETQNLLNDLLGLDYETFTTAVIFGQQTLRFSSATDRSQKEIMERLLGTTQYQDACQIARDAMRKNDAVISLNEVNIKSKDEQIEQIEGQIQLVKEEKEKRKELDVEGIKDSIKKAKKKRSKLKEESLELEEKIDKVAKKQGAAEIEYEKAQDEVSELTTFIRNDNADLDDIEEELKKIGKSKTCPKCKQKMSTSTSEEVIGESKKRRTFIEKRVKKAKVDLEKANEHKTEKKEAYDKYEEQIDKLKNQKAKVVAEKKQLYQQIVDHEKEMEARKDREDSDEVLKGLFEQLEAAKSAKARLIEEKAKTEEEIKYQKFWVDGFGASGLRSYLLDEVVPFLDERTKYYSEMLMDGAISIKFQTVSRLKSGELRDKFKVKVTNRNGAIQYAGNSNGERQRIDLVVSMALQDLARTRSRCRTNLAIFDEVFEGLDEPGCERVVQLLLKEQKRFGSCFVITHNETLAGHFSRRITVRKRGGKTELLGSAK